MPWLPGVSFVASAVAQSPPADPPLSRVQREVLAARLNDRLKMLQRDTELGYQRFRKLVDNQDFDKLKDVFDDKKSAKPLPNGAEDIFQRAIKDYVEYMPEGGGFDSFWPNTWPESDQGGYADCVGKRVQDFLLERQRYLRAIIGSIKRNEPVPKLHRETETPRARAIRAALTVNAVGDELTIKKGIHLYLEEIAISKDIPLPDREGLPPDELSIFNELRRTCPIRKEDQGPPIQRAVGTVPLSVGWDGRCLQADELESDGTAKKPYHPTAAALMYDDGRRGPTTYCSGTLIAPNAVLTAAHCVCDTGAKDPRGSFYRTAGACANGGYSRLGGWAPALDPKHQTVFLPHAGHFKVSRVVVHPQFRWTDRIPVSDLAILFLKTPVSEIAPASLNTLGRLPPNTKAAAVGYGAHNPISASGHVVDTRTVEASAGLKLQAHTETAFCGPYGRLRNLICWRYRTADRFGTRLGSTCYGDSGGPLYANSGGKTYLVGVTSGGGPSCQPDSSAFDIEVFAYKDWIERQLMANPPPPGSGSASSPGRRASTAIKQAVCHFCPMCDQVTGPIKIRNNTHRLRISAHCTPDDITRRSELKLEVSADGKRVLCRSEDPTGEGRTGTAISCVVDEFASEILHVTLSTGLLQQCQIVATRYDRLD
jgi:hypothetical protein